MSFARVRSVGGWLGVIYPSEMETIDNNLSWALDGKNGGAYAPTAQISVGGAGMLINLLTVSTLAQLAAASTGDLSVSGTAEFSGAWVFDQSGYFLTSFSQLTGTAALKDVTATSLTASGAASMGSLSVAGTALINGKTTLGELDVGGILTAFNTVNLLSLTNLYTSTLNAEMSLTGMGRIRKRVASVTDSNMMLSVQTADYYYEASSTLTADRVFTLSDSGASEGSVIKVRLNNTHDVTFQRTDTSNITIYSGGVRDYEFLRTSSGWQLWNVRAQGV